VQIVRAYLEGGSPGAGEGSAATADRYQVVVHVDEAALRGGIGRADAPLEVVKRLACDASVVVVTEDERGTPLNVSRKQRIVSTPLRRAVVARDRRRELLYACRWTCDSAVRLCADDYTDKAETDDPSTEVREPRTIYVVARPRLS
jgi:hypothetical protein